MKRKFAVPFTKGQLSNHFGHAEYFEIIETDKKEIISKTRIEAPAHEHGKLPKWVADLGTTHIITGGIGQKASNLLKEFNITVVYGVETEESEKLVQKYLKGKLQSGLNLCDH